MFLLSAFERPYEVAEEEEREEAGATATAGQPVIINGPIMAGGGYMPSNNGNAVEIADTEQQQTTGNAAPVFVGGGMPATGCVQAPNIENVDEMEKVTEEYVEQVRALNEALQRIAEQSEALGRNMQEMETLGRNLTGMNALYEVQLRSAGGQLDSIDKVN